MRAFFISILVLTVSHLCAQSTDIPLGGAVYDLLDRWDATRDTAVFTTVKPISRAYFAEVAKQINTNNDPLSRYDQEYIQRETHPHQKSTPAGKGLWNTFFKYPSDFFRYQDEDFDLHVNPIVVFGLGKDQESDKLLFQNYRGLEIRGTIDDKVSFYTSLAENQARYPAHVQTMTDSTLGVPFEGFWKQYQETGVDFLRAQGYIDVAVSKHISAQFGFGKHFIGDGQRSLILSDVGNNYPYLRLNTRIWKLQYTNIFAQLISQTEGGDFGLLGIGAFGKKYFVNHRLGIKATPRLEIGLFESVVYGDSTSNQLKVEYLNPIMFYRALEQQDGSADNVILGLDFKWNALDQVVLYGQLVIDELVVSEAFSNSGWWGNKQGIQLGLKYFDPFGIRGLSTQLEYNRVRPYVYSHQDNFASYTHYNMALAHPLGANFKEWLFSVNYRPIPKLRLGTHLILAEYGNDRQGISYGRDPLKSYNLRVDDFGNELLQGERAELTMLHVRATYSIYHNLDVDLEAILRNERLENSPDTNTTILSAGVRWNFAARNYWF